MYFLTILNFLNPNILKELQFPIQKRKTYLQHKFINYAIWYHPVYKKWKIYHPFEWDKMDKFSIKSFKQSKALFGRKFTCTSDIIKYWDYITS